MESMGLLPFEWCEIGKLPGEQLCWRGMWWTLVQPYPAPMFPLCSHPSAGILFSVTVIGPGVAFMLGSAMLRFYVDIDKVTGGE